MRKDKLPDNNTRCEIDGDEIDYVSIDSYGNINIVFDIQKWKNGGGFRGKLERNGVSPLYDEDCYGKSVPVEYIHEKEIIDDRNFVAQNRDLE